MLNEYKNILIIKPSALGDIVMVLPAVSALRSSFPDAKLSWLIRPEFAPLVENHPYVDEVVIFDRKLLRRAWRNGRALGALVSLIKKLRSEKYDAVIDLQGLFRTGVLGWLSGCKNIYGMSDSREFAGFFYTETIDRGADKVHIVDHYLKTVAAAGADIEEPDFLLPVDKKAIESVKKLLNDINADADKMVVFIPCSAHEGKNWPIENFAALAQRIAEATGFSIAAIGTGSQRGVVEKLAKITKAKVINLAGRTSLAELVALLKMARLVVSNDTGPGHVAGALGRPMVMLFGRTNPARLCPYKRTDCVVAAEPWDRPEGINSCDPKHDISRLTVDQVYAKVTEQLSKEFDTAT